MRFTTARFSGYKFTRFSNSFASNRFTTGACRIGLPDSSLSGLLEVSLIDGVKLSTQMYVPDNTVCQSVIKILTVMILFVSVLKFMDE